MTVTHPEKLFWPKQKYTKGDMVSYYMEIADYLLPYLKNRPLMMKRFPEGIEGEAFIQKDTKSMHLPSWIETVAIEHDKKVVEYFLVQNKKTLEFIANLGTIELHLFTCQAAQLDYPDYFVLDLDPEDLSFDSVILAAKTIHQMLEEQKLPHYCKTSGGRGLHIYFPFHGKYSYEQGLQFGQILSHLIHNEMPQITSLERLPSKRQKKIYLDIYQNYSTKTVISTYSVRGKPFAPVSTPLKWDELEKGLKPEDFNMKNMPDRLKKIGDIFLPVLKKGVDLKKWKGLYGST